MRLSLAAPVLALALACMAPASAEETRTQPVDWQWVDAATSSAATVKELESLALAYPDSASVYRRLLGALLESGDPRAAVTALLLVRRGFSFSAATADRIAAAIEREDLKADFRSINERNGHPISASTRIGEVPADALLVEGVARDPASGDLFASTIVSRQLFRKAEGGDWKPVAIGNAGSLAAMARDPETGLIWIASGQFDETPGDPAYAAALGFDPAQGKVTRTLYANGLVPLGDITVGDDGSIFAANPVAGEIHQAPKGADGFRALIGAGVFRSPQGMVKIPGRNRLIVSDYSYGLALLDWDSGKVWRIANASGQWLDGIDALLPYGQSLIAIQNGHRPMRIVKLEMSDDWLTVERSTVLEAANPAWTEPVGAAIDGDRLLYVATGQWGSFGKGGVPVDGRPPRPTAIHALPLGQAGAKTGE